MCCVHLLDRDALCLRSSHAKVMLGIWIAPGWGKMLLIEVAAFQAIRSGSRVNWEVELVNWEVEPALIY